MSDDGIEDPAMDAMIQDEPESAPPLGLVRCFSPPIALPLGLLRVFRCTPTPTTFNSTILCEAHNF